MSDLINKEDALYATEVGRDNWTSPNNSEAWWACGEMRDAIRKAIENLPSIEIIHCKECKWRGEYLFCPIPYKTDDDFFCGKGEKRNDSNL